MLLDTKLNNLAWVVGKVDNAIHWINHYSVHSMVCFVSTCPLDNNNKIIYLALVEDDAIQRISIGKTNYTIRWIVLSTL